MQQKLHYEYMSSWPVPLQSYLSGPSVRMTRLGVMRESAWKRINHLWKQLCSVAADDSLRVAGGWQQAWGPLRLPFFIILPGSCGGNCCKGRSFLPPVVHHKKAGTTRGHADWITGGVDGAVQVWLSMCVLAEWRQNDNNTHFDCNVSSVFCAQVTRSSREHLLYV